MFAIITPGKHTGTHLVFEPCPDVLVTNLGKGEMANPLLGTDDKIQVHHPFIDTSEKKGRSVLQKSCSPKARGVLLDGIVGNLHFFDLTVSPVNNYLIALGKRKKDKTETYELRRRFTATYALLLTRKDALQNNLINFWS